MNQMTNTTVTRESLIANGFAPVGQAPDADMVKVMQGWDMPYVRAHIIDGETVFDSDNATITISGDLGSIQLTVGGYIEDSVDLDADEGKAILRDAGYPI